ncbi:hypothetical protein ARMSODRAFT_560700 [Armillaria solidipes]|uniref:Uncharacterized protein n=1 Tax=Armillaria solidipes TaxID=1076256 RepID=A0A2H3BDT5_9AGAR|nr:hypothetical protein ARMSODRAFT_560700 [Armillaria solidipes]
MRHERAVTAYHSLTTPFHLQSHPKMAMNVAPFPTRLGSDDTLLSHVFPPEPYKTPSKTMNRLAGSTLHHFQLVLPVQHSLLCALAFQYSMRRGRPLGGLGKDFLACMRPNEFGKPHPEIRAP